MIRVEQTDKSTLSHLYIFDDKLNDYLFECFVLEDTLRASKIKKETAIPVGIHPVKPRFEGNIYTRYVEKYNPWHKGMIHIILEEFQFVMIHIGNFIADTEGCPLTGRAFKLNKGIFEVVESTLAYESFYKKVINRIEKGNQFIQIINHPSLKVY